MRFAKSTGAAVLALAMTAGAGADARADDAGKADAGDWSFELGAMGYYKPDYEGSDDYEVSPLPIAEINWRDRVRLTTKGGPGLYGDLLKANGFTVTAGLAYEFGRDEGDNDALKGLGDMEVGAVGSLGLSYEYGPWGASLELDQDIGGDREGMSATLEAEYGHAFMGGQLMMKLSPSVTWANDDYMQNTFGISAAQSLSSARGYSQYEAEAGLKDAGLSLTAIYRITDNINLLGRAGYTRLLGDAADSPIVDRDGSADQFGAGLGIVYRW